jgi:hypothetical protein
MKVAELEAARSSVQVPVASGLSTLGARLSVLTPEAARLEHDAARLSVLSQFLSKLLRVPIPFTLKFPNLIF